LLGATVSVESDFGCAPESAGVDADPCCALRAHTHKINNTSTTMPITTLKPVRIDALHVSATSLANAHRSIDTEAASGRPGLPIISFTCAGLTSLTKPCAAP